MNLNQLKYFSVLAQTEHFTRASEKLFITQPTLTHAIKELEKEMNVSFFDKDGRNIKLNRYGKVFLQYVNGALETLKKGEGEMQKLLNPEHGVVNLGFLPSLAEETVPALLEKFKNDVVPSNINFNFSEGTTKEIAKKLLAGKIDVALSSSISNNSVTSIPIFEQELFLITPASHPLADKKIINFKEIEEDPFIIYKKSSGIRPIVEDILQKIHIEPKIAFELENDDTICGFVAAKLGIAIVPKIYGINHYNIVLHKIPKNLYHRYIYLNYLSNKALSPSVDLFRKYVEKIACIKSAEQKVNLPV
ncbi:LysR family transcriptional regulator [Sporolactobacillus sp. CQH2019]|uniref:LysR family transcriptional regulator n=1 Tax=Sporolactobacillus sp. CQH2019 TaxID=3023512 RepID=UPI002367BB8B|nr:LysR family transcriptional regulator [Sporolactobacillus sp. CQH2019]MDD9149189.1 LysR family transcriptional regulator [Sporolactobacillus sp. CQH2019]